MSGSRPTSGRRPALPLLVVLLVIVVGAIWALRFYQSRPPSGAETSAPGGRVVAHVYFACTRDGQPRMMAAARAVPSGERVGLAALRELTIGRVPPGCTRPLPSATRVLGVRISDGVATADFSPHLVQRFVGGADNEGVVVYAIVNTLASLPGVDRVRILVEGQPIETIGGHIDVSGPLRADHELVIPGEPPDGVPAR
jgi:germination protein M